VPILAVSGSTISHRRLERHLAEVRLPPVKLEMTLVGSRATAIAVAHNDPDMFASVMLLTDQTLNTWS
jgi:hypothetical protein